LLAGAPAHRRGGRVRARGRGAHRLVFGVHLRVRARRGARVDAAPPRLCVDGGLEDAERALDVRPPICLRMRDAVRDGGPCCEVVNDLAALHGSRQRFAIQDRGPFDVDITWDCLEIPKYSSRMIVDDGEVSANGWCTDEM